MGTDALAITIDVEVAGSGSECKTIGLGVRGGCFFFLYLPNILQKGFISLESAVVGCEFDGKKL